MHTDLYLISNASMLTYPDNKRNKYCNQLIRPLSRSLNSRVSTVLALDSITLENSIIQYPSLDDYPDIFCFNKSVEDKPDIFKVSEVYYETPTKFLQHLKSECVSVFFKNIYLQGGKISLESNGKYTFISTRLFDFLKLLKKNSLRVLGVDWLDGRFKRYYGKYYAIEAGDFQIFHAYQKFDLYINSPRFIKILSSNIKLRVRNVVI